MKQTGISSMKEHIFSMKNSRETHILSKAPGEKTYPTRKIYKVQSSEETVETIAEKIYGKKSKEVLIRIANGLKKDEKLKPGQILVLPGVIPLDRNELELMKKEILGAMNNMKASLPSGDAPAKESTRTASSQPARKNIFKNGELSQFSAPSSGVNPAETDPRTRFLDSIATLYRNDDPKTSLIKSVEALKGQVKNEKIKKGTEVELIENESIDIDEEPAAIDNSNSQRKESVIGKKKGSSYVVERDSETLSSIALKFYGNADMYPVIAEANSIKNPDIIYKGQKLFIPEIEKKSEMSLRNNEPLRNNEHASEKALVAEYIVKRENETWQDLARRFYGDETMADTLALANGKLLSQRIKTGDRLLIPGVKQEEIPILDEENTEDASAYLSEAEFKMELDNLIARIRYLDIPEITSKPSGTDKSQSILSKSSSAGTIFSNKNSREDIDRDFLNELSALEKKLIEV